MRRAGSNHLIVWLIVVLTFLGLCWAGRATLDRLTVPGASAALALVISIAAQFYLAVVVPSLTTRFVAALNYLLGCLLIIVEFLGLEFGLLEPAGKTFEGAFGDRLVFVAMMLVGWVPMALFLTGVNRLALRTIGWRAQVRTRSEAPRSR